MPVNGIVTRAAAWLTLPLLAACTAGPTQHYTGYRAPQVSSVELRQTLLFPGRSARAHIQLGKPLRWQDLDQWTPHCSFGLNRRRDGKPLAREIEPTVFTVLDSRAWVDVSQGPAENRRGVPDTDRRLLLAGPLTRFGRNRDVPSLYIYRTRLALYSKQAPQVDDLTCAYRGSRTDRSLTLDQIRDTLGDIARIH